MPEQILLQGKIQGTEEFLLAGLAEGRVRAWISYMITARMLERAAAVDQPP